MAKKLAATIRDKNSKRNRLKKQPPVGLAENVSAADLAALLADPPFSDRWLRKLADDGYLVKSGRGEYVLGPSIQGYIRFVRETEVKGAVDAATSREAFEMERARKLKLENDQREALLIETPDALAAIDQIFGEVRTGLAGVAAQVTDDVAFRRKIDDAHDAILAGLATRFEQTGAALREGRDPAQAGAEDTA